VVADTLTILPALTDAGSLCEVGPAGLQAEEFGWADLGGAELQLGCAGWQSGLSCQWQGASEWLCRRGVAEVAAWR
jgi:hypothetical protein